MKQKQQIVAIAMGGYSTEFEISLKSGEVVYEALSNSYFKVYKVHILKEGWYYVMPDGTTCDVIKGSFGCNYKGSTIIPDVVFNTIHGTPGEDGILAAYLKMLNIPQTSTHFYQAALSFNKRDTLSVLKSFGIQCAPSVYINKGDYIDPQAIVNKVGLPCFVKPSRAGSSFGISRVTQISNLEKAIQEAYKEDTQVLIETEIKGTEVSIGVYKHNNEIHTFAPTEIVSENEFFDYEAKYLGKSQEITPARIPSAETLKVQEIAKQIYKLLDMKGVTRSEFIIQEGLPYFIETNTTPGLSKESIIPKQVRQAGMQLTAFFVQLVENALIEQQD